MEKDERWKYIETLSDLRAKYSCFEESEEPYYRALSAAIKAIREQMQESQVAEGIDNPWKVCIANGTPLPKGMEG